MATGDAFCGPAEMPDAQPRLPSIAFAATMAQRVVHELTAPSAGCVYAFRKALLAVCLKHPNPEVLALVVGLAVVKIPHKLNRLAKK